MVRALERRNEISRIRCRVPRHRASTNCLEIYLRYQLYGRDTRQPEVLPYMLYQMYIIKLGLDVMPGRAGKGLSVDSF